MQRGVIEAELVHHAVAKIFHQHISTRCQREQRRAPGGFSGIEHDAAFVEVARNRVGAHALGAVAGSADPVAMWRLHLDDIRALTREDAGAHRPGDALTQVEHGNVFERLHDGGRCVMRLRGSVRRVVR